MRTIVGQPSEDTELISQTEQRDSDALLQTTNPFPETSHNAQWTSIRQSRSTMHNSNSHLPRLWPIVIMEVKPLPKRNPNLTASSIKDCARKTGSETMVTNARWKGAWAVPSYLCPSPSLPHLSPHPLPPFFVHIWWQKICRPAALALCHSGTQRLPTAGKSSTLCINNSFGRCTCNNACVFRKWTYIKINTEYSLIFYPWQHLSISNLIVTPNKLTH